MDAISSIPLWIIIIAFWVLLVGLIWAPFAAITCILIAHSKSLNVIRYGVVGAVYSAAFILPWIYLTLRMFGVRTKRGIVLFVYCALYICVWMPGPIAINIVIALELFPSISTLILIVNVLIGIKSIRAIQRRDRYDRRNDTSLAMKYSQEHVNDMWTKSLPDSTYIVPFALIPIWILLSLSPIFFEPWV